MNKEDKIYLLDKCIYCYTIAKEEKLSNPFVAYQYYGAGNILKKIIEEKINCQINPYYKKYLFIVELQKNF